MTSFSASFCKIQIATILFLDAVGLGECASEVFWRHNQTDRKRGFFHTRLEKRLFDCILVKVFDELLESIRDRNLLKLFQRLDW